MQFCKRALCDVTKGADTWLTPLLDERQQPPHGRLVFVNKQEEKDKNTVFEKKKCGELFLDDIMQGCSTGIQEEK